MLIFNPEHDLCLANGGRSYVPPDSARQFAEQCADVMRIIYHPGFFIPRATVIPWGWNTTLRHLLIKKGIEDGLLPTENELQTIKTLQHRKTALPLLKDSIAADTLETIVAHLSKHGDIVMKAPWSGSGRGLRWVSAKLTQQDMLWAKKVIRSQQCVIVEPRRNVCHNYALEFFRHDHKLNFVGFSLFSTKNGVYQSNLLLDDNTISKIVDIPESEIANTERWLASIMPDFYEGPIGVDYYTDHNGEHFCSEINFRHTMGLVAHEYRACHPEHNGWTFGIAHDKPGEYRIETKPHQDSTTHEEATTVRMDNRDRSKCDDIRHFS